MGRAADMAAARGRARTAVVVLMLVLAALLGLLWKLWSSSSRDRVLVPSGRFWRPWPDSRAFWNREQQRLDLLYSPIFHPNGSLGNRSLTPQDPCTADPRVPTQVSDYNTLPRRFQDFLLHMRCRSSRLRISPPRGCGGGNGGGNGAPFLLLAVKSLVPHFARRQAIRETWGRAGVVGGRSVVTLFLLGDASPADHHPALQGMLGEEARLHGDLLQWDYRDSFFNLTLKDVLFLQWFGRRCRRARYVLKGDDDVFVNTPRVLQLLAGLDQVQTQDLFLGDVISAAAPHRDPQLKYFVPESVFEGSYPPYAGGGGYLLSGELALRLLAASRRVALYPIDDVYTGMCLQKLGVAPQRGDGFRTFGLDAALRGNPCVYRSLVLVHGCSPQELMELWPWVEQPARDCQ
ncbi:N-acetyllactosaminide beta-1,3-N-acetylglucosaminyltransferase 2-like isoform X2 [Cololabis saira]|uniref:N-acetyllactosaminide beta-1,3-N-acetylglucosaminyltransferase 2-like isoform X2 n=1 Tax=Cololabis saira TaxID=129043 RepID=UPI002AD42A9F|nr:N-acetyllactosaminide beta-1,3-N-acetylglucosaminyltransferase 2-like isoform X2 [Cololabis saira]